MKNTELSNYSYTKIENDPRTALSKGTIITDMSSKSLKTDELIKDSYEIIDLIGSGGSALVYKAYKMSQTSIEKEFCLLKEIYPKNYNFDIIRSPKMKNGLKCEYLKIDELISVYIKATKEEIEIHNEASTNDEGRRSTYFFKKSSIFTADNNLTYVVLDTVQGETLQYLLENNKVKSLSEICGYMISAVNALEHLHGNNVLHLDLSPDNFFVCATTTKEEYDLKIIDYNSARKYVEGKGVSVLHGLSSKQEFEAPEVSIYKADVYAENVPIDYRADLYSVAAIFYYILFNDSVPRTENTYANEGKIKCKESTYFNTVPLTAQKLTREFLLKGLSIQPWNRYENCEEMREALLLIKKEAEEPIWLLPSAHMEEPQYCVRRDQQIKEIDEILEKKNHIFISGIGGSGKTTLATLYALANKDKYHTVQMVTCSSSINHKDEKLKELERNEGLKGLIARLEFAGIDDNKYVSNLGYDIESMYKDKLKALNMHTDKNTLLIIDNINAINKNDKDCLSTLLKVAKCSIIFTTRIKREDYYFPEEKINEEEVIELLQNILKDKPDMWNNLEGLKEIIKLTNKHYLLTKMVGLYLAAFPVEISYVIDKLKKGESFEKGKIEVDKNDEGLRSEEETTIESYLLEIFDLSLINDNKKFILSAMTIVPYSGMDKDKFIKSLNLDIFDDNINELIRLGWITEHQNIISLHQVISDLLYRTEETKPDWGKLDEFIDSDEYSQLLLPNTSKSILPLNACFIYKKVIKKLELYQSTYTNLFYNLGKYFERNTSSYIAEMLYLVALRENIRLYGYDYSNNKKLYVALGNLFLNTNTKHGINRAEQCLLKAMSLCDYSVENESLEFIDLYLSIGLNHIEDCDENEKERILSFALRSVKDSEMHFIGKPSMDKYYTVLDYITLCITVSKVVFQLTENFELSNNYLLKSQKCIFDIGLDNSVVLADVYFSQGLMLAFNERYDEAIDCLKKTESILCSYIGFSKNVKRLCECYCYLSQLYEIENNTANSDKYHKLATDYAENLAELMFDEVFDDDWALNICGFNNKDLGDFCQCDEKDYDRFQIFFDFSDDN